MQSHKNITLPPAGSTAVGIYEAQVVETVGLSRLRRKAFSVAGLTGEYDGSVKSYLKLTPDRQALHDRYLSEFVREANESLTPKKRRARNRSAKLILTTGERHNLILDQGLNKLLRSSGNIDWSEFSVSCAAGTGTTATYTDSGSDTATSTGTTVTMDGAVGFFTAGMVGQLIKFDSGEERYITAQASTSCTINTALEIAGSTLFTVWAVNQTGLASEAARNTTYLTGSGNCGSSIAGNVWSGKRTYDLAAEVGNVNYTELGWSDSATPAANLNSRTLISGGTVSVLIGQQLRVIYTISVTATPNASTPGTYSITGWPVAPAATVDGDYMYCTMTPFRGIDTSGNPTGSVRFPAGRSTPSIILATGSVLPSFGSSYTAGTIATSNTNSVLSYTDGNFYLDIQGIFNLSTGNATNWRGIYSEQTSGFAFVFDEAQTKASTHTLTIRARMTVGRTLTNP